ncbi:MAG TPA: hypothetical protein DIC42_04975 [Holosporales bacterium]|nr:hypothetical protein [Holosporales bacterium]
MIRNIQTFINYKHASNKENKRAKNFAPHYQLLNSLLKKVVLGLSTLSPLSASTPLDIPAISSSRSRTDSQMLPESKIRQIRHTKTQMAPIHTRYQAGLQPLKKCANAVNNLMAAELQIRTTLQQHEGRQVISMINQFQIEFLKIKEKKSIGTNLLISVASKANEEAYQDFLKLKLIYKPDPKSDIGRMIFSVQDLANLLYGIFDLSGCGEAGKYVSISTGYRQEKNPENKNKIEVWFTPRFIVEQHLNSTAVHFSPIWQKWRPSIQVGVFFTYGSWGSRDFYFYEITKKNETLNNLTLYDVFNMTDRRPSRGCLDEHIRPEPAAVLQKISMCFSNP